MTDPKLMAAQLYRWANVADRLAVELHNAYREHAAQTAMDLAAQMRQVAQREDR